MVEEKSGAVAGGVSGGGRGGGGGSGGDESSRLSTSFEKFGDRQRFTVELRPEDTTIVSWKKLIKDADKVNGSGSASVLDPPPTNAPPTLEARIAPEQRAEADLQDPVVPRFSAVIEKIERLYMGNDSSNGEDLDDIPDDDQYDTEDSFIDDAELDEYFQVDNSAIKHDGFFINRGKLERINKSTPLPNPPPKKRQRKDIAKDNVHLPKKRVKVAKTTSVKSAPLDGKNVCDASQCLPHQNEVVVRCDNELLTSKKNAFDIKSSMDKTIITKASNIDAKDPEKKKTEAVVHSKNTSNKVKDLTGPGPSDSSVHHKYLDRSYSPQLKAHSGSLMNGVKDIDHSYRSKERNDIRGQIDINNSGGTHSMQGAKTSFMHSKDGSSLRPKPKGPALEKAIKELEKMVAESRPATLEVQIADTSSQAVKKRLPPVVKAKLAKVARLTACHGKVSTELLDRLMSIVGHFMQLRTLKRNLKAMINTEIAAKQALDDRVRQKKKEVTEMIKTFVASKEFEDQAGSSDDFQSNVSGEKGTMKRKCIIDNTLEDKICELYDIFVNGLEEDVGPQLRKMYVELAELWPNGYMDHHGIRRAICNAKERHFDQQKKDQAKMSNLSRPKVEDMAQGKAITTAQAQGMRKKLPIDSTTHAIAAPSKPLSISMPNQMHTSINAPSLDRTKHEKAKVSSSTNSLDEMRASNGALVKKKMKRKPEDLGEGHFRPKKLISQNGEEKQSSTRQVSTSLPDKSNLPSAAHLPPPPPSLEQLS